MCKITARLISAKRRELLEVPSRWEEDVVRVFRYYSEETEMDS